MFCEDGFTLLRTVLAVLNPQAISIAVYIGVSENFDPSS